MEMHFSIDIRIQGYGCARRFGARRVDSLGVIKVRGLSKSCAHLLDPVVSFEVLAQLSHRSPSYCL